MKTKDLCRCGFFQKILLLVLLTGFSTFAQIKKGDAFRNRIDSLNRVAFDEPVKVSKMANSLLKIAKQNKRIIDWGLLLQVKGVAETSLGNNPEALRYHMRSYHIFDSINNDEGKIYALINIGAVHLNQENFKKGQDYLFRALSISDKKDANILKTIYVNLGVSYEYTGNQKQAVEYYNKAIPYLEQAKDYNGLAVNYHNIAEAFNTLQDYKSAEVSELKALEYHKKAGSKSTLAMISLRLGSLYVKSGQLEKAKSYLEAGGKAAHELDSPYYKETFYQEMAEYCKVAGEPAKGIVYLQQLMALREKIHSDEIIETNARIEGQFQNNIKTNEIQLLKLQKKFDASKIEKNRFWGIFFLIISVLCAVIILIMYRNYKFKQEANLLLKIERTKLKEQNLQLKNENILVQFETLKNQVSPHFLFNSLNALASLIRTNPTKAVEFTNAFSKIFRNTLELKDRHLVTLEEELQHVNAYLSLQKMRFGENLIINISIPADKMKDYLPPFSLQMVIENAVKHNSITSGQPLKIDIGIEGDFLVVKNNLQLRKFVEDSTETGVRNIRSRYKYVTALEPVFEIRNNEYYVQLPLIQEEC